MFKKLFLPIIVIGLIVLFIITVKVPEGKVAVVYTPSGGATKVLPAGWHFVGLFNKTQKYPTRIQTVKTNIDVATQDGKKITLPVSYELRVDKDKVIDIFKSFGSQDIEDLQASYLNTKLYKASRETVAGYSLLDIYGTKTTDASTSITEDFSKRVAKMGFVVNDVTLGTPKADVATQTAIDARVKASQENELEKQQLQNEKIKAEKKKVIAKGEADAEIAKAEGKAKANEKISHSVDESLIKYTEAQARLKHGWITTTGADTIVTDETK